MTIRLVLFLLAILMAPAALAQPVAPAAAAQPASFLGLTDPEICASRSVSTDLSDIDVSSCRPFTNPLQADSQGRVLWLRGRLVVPEGYPATAPLGLHVGAIAAREIWWNGERIGDSRGGRPGASAETEIPGRLDTVDWIPPRLLLADNSVAMRLSTFHLDIPVTSPFHYAFVAPYGEARFLMLRNYAPGLAAAGALIVAALFFGYAYLTDRRALGSLLISIMSLCLVGQFGLESSRALLAYPYPLQVWRLVGITTLAFAFALSMTAYVAGRFAPKRWRLYVAMAAGLALLLVQFMPGFDGRTLGFILAPSVIAVAAAVQGLLARRRGATAATLALAVFITLQLFESANFLEQTLYLSASLLALVLFADQVLALRRARDAEEQATRRAAQLELELLRRRIAPHFLMNTLNALTEWVESDPKTSVKMIEALAEEFRLLSQISDRALIPLSEEIALCRRHLEVMSYRVDRAFSLSTRNIDESAEVPPGVLHTLVENAFTHGRFEDGGDFILTSERDAQGERLVLLTPSATATREPARAGAGGEGLAYVRRRLEAAFGSGAHVESGASEAGWRTVLTIPRPAVST